jgi:predicted ATP-grasp superfamily ATP-dependent carboligase
VTALAIIREAAHLRKNIFIVDNVDGIAMKSRYPVKYLLATTDEDSILSQLKCLADHNTVLIADCDRWLRFIAKYYLSLKVLFADILHPVPETLALCLHKVDFLEWCHKKNFPAPKLYNVNSKSDFEHVVDFPVILRPEETQHGKESDLPKAVEAVNASELQRWLILFENNNIKPVVCESALSASGSQFSVGVARQNGKTISFVAEKVRPVAERCCGGSYVVGRQNSTAKDLAEQVLEAFDYSGIAEVEILYDPLRDKYWIIEVNARPWVQFPMAAKLGCNLLSFSLGEGNIVYETKARGCYWMWFSADIYECCSRSDGLIATSQLSVSDYFKSLLQANVYAFWDRKDMRPFFVELLKLVSALKASVYRRLLAK